jgi:hypothetical protein
LSTGLYSGLKSAITVLMLYIVLLFVFAVIAIEAFSETDPFHFRDIDSSMLSLFIASTLDWSNTFQNVFYGEQ